MANLYHDGGKLMAEVAGMGIPFEYLTGYGVAEVVRVCLGLEPLCVAEARGSKGKGVNEGEVLAKMAGKILTEEGLEWAKRNRPKAAPVDARLLIPEVAPDSEEEELAVLMGGDATELSL